MTGSQKHNFYFILSLLLIFALCSCVSIEKRFEKGKEMENQGRFEEAARHYIRILEKDPSWEEVRQRLENVGTQAVDIYLEQARAFKTTGSYEEAVDTLNRIDDLRSRTDEVGVTLPVPDDYADFHREMTEAAIESLFKQGENAERSEDWAEAVRKYERLKNLYPLSPDQIIRADQACVRSYTNWAEQDLIKEYFRAAFDHAQMAIDIFGPEHSASMDALKIQQAALDAGTRILAVLPFWPSDEALDEMPRGFARESYDVLVYEFMDEPIPFIVPIEPGQIHREIRRLRLRDREITQRMAARIGQNIGADFVVTGEIRTFLENEIITQEKEHEAPFKRDKSKVGVYIEQRYKLKLTTRIRFQVIDSLTRRILAEDSARSEASDQFRRGIYEGDHTELELSRSERRLFDRDRLRRAEQELIDRLIDKLAERLAEKIYNRTLHFIS
jgi:tetratricopeptide (TPR) repeat protein